MAVTITTWFFAVLFAVIGILNAILISPVPGVLYLILACIYLPAVNVALKRRVGFAIPMAVRIVVGLVILWGTLAVGDLAELFGL